MYIFFMVFSLICNYTTILALIWKNLGEYIFCNTISFLGIRCFSTLLLTKN